MVKVFDFNTSIQLKGMGCRCPEDKSIVTLSVCQDTCENEECPVRELLQRKEDKKNEDH